MANTRLAYGPLRLDIDTSSEPLKFTGLLLNKSLRDDESEDYESDYESDIDDEANFEADACEKSPVLSGERLAYVETLINKAKSYLDNKRMNNTQVIDHLMKDGMVNLWFYPKHPVFIKNAKLNKFTRPVLFMWLPRLLGATITCPHCLSTSTVSCGWPTKPIARRIVGLNDCYWIVSRRQQCKTCEKKFNSNNSITVSNMEPHFRDMFPAFLTARSGLDLQVVNLLRASVAESLGINPFRNLLKANHMRSYDSRKLAYYSSLPPTPPKFRVKFEEFPAFKDPAYGGFVPSTSYLSEVYTSFILSYEAELTSQIVKASGTILGVDHSFKVCSFRFS